MFNVPTPRGEVRVSQRRMADASDRLYRLSPERRETAARKANKVLDRRDSRRAAAIAAAAAALAALTIPAAAL